MEQKELVRTDQEVDSRHIQLTLPAALCTSTAFNGAVATRGDTCQAATQAECSRQARGLPSMSQAVDAAGAAQDPPALSQPAWSFPTQGKTL